MEETEDLDLDSEVAEVEETDFLQLKIVLAVTVNKTTRMSISTADSEEEGVETVSIRHRTVSEAIVSKTTKISTLTIHCLENEGYETNFSHTESYTKDIVQWFTKIVNKILPEESINKFIHN